MVNWFSILLALVAVGIVVQMLRTFPSKETPKYVFAFVFIGWLLPLLAIVLVPYDVYVTITNDGSKEFIYVC
jgi:hypothetical protein